MGNQNKGVLIVLQKFGKPFDMFNVQIVGRLVQQQNLGVLQQQLSKQNLAALTAGKLAYVFIKPMLPRPRPLANSSILLSKE